MSIALFATGVLVGAELLGHHSSVNTEVDDCRIIQPLLSTDIELQVLGERSDADLQRQILRTQVTVCSEGYHSQSHKDSYSKRRGRRGVLFHLLAHPPPSIINRPCPPNQDRLHALS